jgi:uncharacterized SAM-binding protein YcdF (DUF218 family)
LKQRPGVRHFVSFTLIVAALCAWAWLEREALLRDAASLWVVSDQITHSDAIVVLGGREDWRPFIAADLYKKGVAPKILVSGTRIRAREEIGTSPTSTQPNLAILKKLGVPDDAVDLFGEDNKSTRDEAVALKRWAQQNAVFKFLIPSEPFFARRARWIFEHEFSGMPVQIAVPSFDPPEYTREEWWKSNGAMLAFQMEILKYLYYRYKY